MQGTWIPSLVRGLRSYLNQNAPKNNFFFKSIQHTPRKERKDNCSHFFPWLWELHFSWWLSFSTSHSISPFLQPIPSFLRYLSLWWTYLFYTSKPIFASWPRLITATKTLNLFFPFSCLFSDTRHAKWLGGRPSSKSVEPLFSLVGRIPFFG